MRRQTKRPPQPAHIPQDIARYSLAVALLALIAALLLLAWVAPDEINLPVMLPLLIPLLRLVYMYYFEQHKR